MAISADPSTTALREQIAMVTRMLETSGVLNYSGHVSSRVPDSDDILIQPRNDSRATLRAERVLRVKPSGEVVAGDDKPPSELAIHAAIYKVRPDVNAVLHCHMASAVRLTLMQGVTLQPLLVHATRWKSGIPTHAFPGHIETPDQGRALAETLGNHNVALMRAHGLVLVSESVPAVFVDAMHFDENAEAYLDVLRCGATPAPLSEAEIQELVAHERRGHHVRKIFGFYADKLGEKPDPAWTA
jgi:L-ribulose-5-phosphate 4-epimerase